MQYINYGLCDIQKISWNYSFQQKMLYSLTMSSQTLYSHEALGGVGGVDGGGICFI